MRLAVNQGRSTIARMPPNPPPLIALAEMPAVAGLRVPRDLHVVLRAPVLLGGMRFPDASRWQALHDAGFRRVVCLVTEEPPYDPSPLKLGGAIHLTDLVGGRHPPDEQRETQFVSRAVQAVMDALRAGEGVVVHCAGGCGRTGTVLGCVLVLLGHEPSAVIAYLRSIHESRGRTWPESPWQSELVASLNG